MSPGSTLYSPLQLGDLQFSNRLALAPLTRARADSGRLANSMMAEYYAQRAGAGLLISEATTVSEQANGWVGTPGIYTEQQAQSWQPVVNAVHAKNSKIFIQLWHTGRVSHSDFHNGHLPVAPSAITLKAGGIHTPLGKKDFEQPRALETDEIQQVVADYHQAAVYAQDAGFDGIELHAANGYLLDQFLHANTNQRQDQYGGSIENRFRLLDEVTQAVCKIYPPHRVGIRLSPNGQKNDMGAPDFRETFDHAAHKLDQLQIGYLHVIDGLSFGFHQLGKAIDLQHVRTVYKGMIIGNGGYQQKSAEQAIQQDTADMIAIGRDYISNPDLVERYRNNWSLAPASNPSTWYGQKFGKKGYTDYPAFSPES